MSNYYVHKFGRAGDVDQANVDVYDVSTGDYEFPTVAFQTQIAGIANDIPSSDGVHSVVIHGLDINGVEVTEVATMNGATPVVLANSYYRVNRAYIDAVGATGVNSGQINITHTGSATLARISPLEGQTLQTIFTVPAGVRGGITGWHAEAARETSQVDVQAGIRIQTRAAGKGWRTRDAGIAGTTQNIHRDFHHPEALTVDPLTDIRMRVTAINTNNVAITGGFELQGFRDIR